MSTKLEELKALIAEEKKWRTEYINARIANDDREDVASFRLSFRAANKLKLMLNEELLPHLIAVAEAAQCIRHWHDQEPDGVVVSREHVFLLWAALEPLTKDAGK